MKLPPVDHWCSQKGIAKWATLKKAKSRNSPQVKWYRALRNSTTRAIRCTHERYVQDIIGDLDSATLTDQFAGIKRLWDISSQNNREYVGVPTLRTQHGQHHTNSDKAKVLNNQFESAINRDSLGSVPSLESPYPLCPDIIFTSPGITKLLKNLQPHKTTGTDCLPPRILGDLAEVITPPSHWYYNRSMTLETHHKTGGMRSLAPYTKRL